MISLDNRRFRVVHTTSDTVQLQMFESSGREISVEVPIVDEKHSEEIEETLRKISRDDLVDGTFIRKSGCPDQWKVEHIQIHSQTE